MSDATRSFSDLSPSEFENFTFDILSASGVRKLTWRTPGADGGRDIEGEVYNQDFSGFQNRELWYFECKRYSQSLDWPLVYEKISHADINGADFLLIVTNSNPSPTCETNITAWNVARRAPKVRFWRGYELTALVNRFPAVGAKYGLCPAPQTTVGQFIDLAMEISKLSQAAYAAVTVGTEATPLIEASSALSELFLIRMKNMSQTGRFEALPIDRDAPLYPWVSFAQDLFASDIALRACLATLRVIVGADTIEIQPEDAHFVAVPNRVRIRPSNAAYALISNVAIWADLELILQDGASMRIVSRVSNQE